MAWHRILPLELFSAADPSLTDLSPAAKLWASDGGADASEARVGGAQETVEQEEKARLFAASWRWEILGSSAKIMWLLPMANACKFIISTPE